MTILQILARVMSWAVCFAKNGCHLRKTEFRSSDQLLGHLNQNPVPHGATVYPSLVGTWCSPTEALNMRTNCTGYL